MKRLRVLIGAALVGVIVAELFARLAGFSPYRTPGAAGTAALFVADSLLGYIGRPGLIELPSSDGSAWLAIRHDEDGHRAVEPADNYLHDSQLPEIWCVGGSELYAVGKEDRETLPWRLNDRLREMPGTAFSVRNFSAPGYTESQSFLALRRSIEWGDRPFVVVLDTRFDETAATRRGRYSLQTLLGDAGYRIPEIETFEPQQVRYRQAGYRPLMLSRRLAIVNAFDTITRSARTRKPEAAVLEETVRYLRLHDVGVVLLQWRGREVAISADDTRVRELILQPERESRQVADEVATAIRGFDLQHGMPPVQNR